MGQAWAGYSKKWWGATKLYLPFFLPVNFLRNFNFHFCAMGQ